jgi:hypothetical protein
VRAGIVGAALWVAALTATGVGMTFAPTEACGDDNKADWVAAADRAGTLFAIAAALGAVATPFLIAEALGRRGRGRIAFTLASVLSAGATLYLALAAFLNLVVQCLE